MSLKVAVTGSSGFIGSYFTTKNPEFLITEIDLLKNKIESVSFEGIDVVLHLAAIAHQKDNNENLYYTINRDLAYKTALRAKEHGVKQFLFMSTVKVYGESSETDNPFDESSDCNPKDAYGKSKFEAEKLIQALENDNFRVAIIRSPLVYGPEVRANMLSLIKLVNRIPMLPFANVNNKRSLVYIGNMNHFIRLVILQRASGIFLPADNETLSIKELCSEIAKAIEKKVFFFSIPNWFVKIIRCYRPSIYNKLFSSFEIDNHKTRNILSYISPYSSKEGIHNMIDWYKKPKYR
ncbi:MAG: NAD-dependent epimerase/dehydratase family protein [Bacteroidales bacterium]|jgi:UDP-glucose 4-epimerase|nr:NAD-dependent epimerase/dehydratase family protein [Bacteroidales bacterium]